MGIIDIDFRVFFYMVVGLFGLAGFLRGWWKEAITTGLLAFLLILLEYPDLAATIIGKINDLLSQLRGSSFVASGTVPPPGNVDPGQSQVYIITLIVLIVVSYFIGKAGVGDAKLTTGGRIFGGVLGLTNGFIILSLLREYVLRRFLPGAGVSAAAAVPNNLTVTVSNVPRQSIMDGFAIWVFIIGGALLLIFAISNRIQYTKGKIGLKPPMGHK